VSFIIEFHNKEEHRPHPFNTGSNQRLSPVIHHGGTGNGLNKVIEISIDESGNYPMLYVNNGSLLIDRQRLLIEFISGSGTYKNTFFHFSIKERMMFLI
jgi:hypothetical protein